MTTMIDAARVTSAASAIRPGTSGSSQSVRALDAELRAPSSSSSSPPDPTGGTTEDGESSAFLSSFWSFLELLSSELFFLLELFGESSPDGALPPVIWSSA